MTEDVDQVLITNLKNQVTRDKATKKKYRDKIAYLKAKVVELECLSEYLKTLLAEKQ